MEMNYNDIFQFPNRCLLNKRLTKVFFTKNFDLTSSEKKILNTHVTKMEWVASIKPSNSNIPKFENDLYVFDEIQLMTCKISSAADKIVKTVAELFQKYIPYPIVLVIENDSHWTLSTSSKRVNQNDRSKRTIERLYISAPISVEAVDKSVEEFKSTLPFPQLNKTNLMTVYQEYVDAMIQLQSYHLTGVFNGERTHRSNEDLEHLLRIETIQTELISLKSQLKKETQLNSRVSINMEIQRRKQDIENIKNTLTQ